MPTQTCQQTWLHSFSYYLHLALVVLEHVSAKAQPVLHHSVTEAEPSPPEPQEPALSCNEPFLVCVCEEVMAQKAPISPKASRAQCEWQNRGFTWWHLAIQAHIQGCVFILCATGSSAPQPAAASDVQ